MTVPCNIVRLGVVDYMEGLTLQERLADQVKEGRSDGWITFLEHPHTYTFGRAGKAENLHLTPEQLDEIGARVYWVNRGGDVTEVVQVGVYVEGKPVSGNPLRYVQPDSAELLVSRPDAGPALHRL